MEMTRRTFLSDLGRGMVAVAVVGLTACAETGSRSTEPRPSPSGGVDWHRVNLGFVSAYLLVREGEAAAVDTGVEGSADDLDQGLGAAGLDWSSVGHVILTHRHPDHIGSLPEVLSRAPDAAAYAGEEDIPAIGSPRPLQAVSDGDQVFGLTIVATPGHTPGHISVLDPVGGLLVAGDALNGSGGGVAGPDPRFSSDMATAIDSVRKLAQLDFDTVVFGHGDPVEGDAAAQVSVLAEDL